MKLLGKTWCGYSVTGVEPTTLDTQAAVSYFVEPGANNNSDNNTTRQSSNDSILILRNAKYIILYFSLTTLVLH